MTFGSNETFVLIGDSIQKGNYDQLCIILYDDIEMLIRKYCSGLQTADQEEILQIAVSKVISGLPWFYLKSADKTERERNAWLKTIVMNERNTFFRKQIRQIEKDAEPLDELYDQAGHENVEHQIENRDALFDALHTAFSIRSTPDKLLAFVYNRLLGTFAGLNGSPKSIVAEFTDVPLISVYNQMRADLEEVLETEIPDYILKPLYDKVLECKNQPFSLSVRTITDSSNWIVSKMKEHRKHE